MLGAIHGDLPSRPATATLTLAEQHEREQRREAVRALLSEIAKPPAPETDERKTA